MKTITKPEKGQDVRLLHRTVRELIDGINSILNMTGQYEGKVRGYFGIGHLIVRQGDSEMRIRASDPGELGGIGVPAAMSLVSSKNPAKQTEPVHFIATVFGAYDGTVTFQVADGSPPTGVIGTYPVVNQIATTPDITALGLGNHHIVAQFSGDSTHGSATVIILQTITERPVPNIAITSSQNPADEHAAITFTVDLSVNPPPLPTGNVNITDNGSLLWSLPVPLGGVIVTPSIDTLTPGHHTIEADYTDDTNWGEAFNTLDQIIKGQPTLTMHIDPEPVRVNSPFDVTCDVTPLPGLPEPTGNVHVYFDGVVLASGVLINGSVVFRANAGLPTATTHTWFFNYEGDGNYAGGNSPVFIQHVVPGVPNPLASNYETQYCYYNIYGNGVPPPRVFQWQFTDPAGVYNGVIGIQFVGGTYGGHVRVYDGGSLFYDGYPNLYFNGVPMRGSTIYANMVNGFLGLIISWDVPGYAIVQPNWATAGDQLALRLFDPADNTTIVITGGFTVFAPVPVI